MVAVRFTLGLYRIAQASYRLGALGALNFPHTSHTFSCDSSGTANTIRWPLGLSTLPAIFFFATDTVVTWRIVGNWCTTTELLMREVKGSVWTGMLAPKGSSMGVIGVEGAVGAGAALPGPWVLSISRM